MNAPEHALRAHAFLSCSSSERWLNCTVAPSLEARYQDERSAFAAEGTTAHELGERCLVSGRHANEVSGDYSQEMRDYVQQYVDYVRGFNSEFLHIEQRLDISAWVPECFGTADAVILEDGLCRVVDLKFGKGLRVDATDNTQLMLYALGAHAAHDPIHGPFERFELHIVQPRLDHIDVWEISAADLLAWGESIKPIAQMAFRGEGVAKSGDHCQFCKARHTCAERYNANIKLATEEFGEMPTGQELTDDDLAAIYPRLDAFVRWANDLQAYCLTRAEAGVRYTGLKLVEGRSIRKIVDEMDAIERLRAQGFDDYEIMNTKPKGITELEKLLGKPKFAEVLGDLIIKPAGRPTLVGSDDPRPELATKDTAQADFQ